MAYNKENQKANSCHVQSAKRFTRATTDLAPSMPSLDAMAFVKCTRHAHLSGKRT